MGGKENAILILLLSVPRAEWIMRMANLTVMFLQLNSLANFQHLEPALGIQI
jgi:hypothetical protein